MTPRSIRVAGIRRDLADLMTGILMLGSPGSGKTSLIKKMLVDILRLRIAFLAVDLADELTDFVLRRGPIDGGVIDRIAVHQHGGSAVDFPLVLTNETRLLQFGKKIFPDVKNDHQPIFNTGAREAFISACRLLVASAGQRWELADAFRLAMRPALLRLIAKLMPGVAGGDPFGQFGGSQLRRDISANIVVKLRPLSIYAALAERCPRKVSPLRLAQPGAKGGMILVWKDTLKDALEGIYSFVLDLVAEERMSMLSTVPLFILTDELRTLQKLECVPTLARRGRKSGVGLVMSVHEISGMRDRYGREEADEILSLMAHKVFLRIAGVETAKWASDCLGVVDTLTGHPPIDPSGKDRTIRPQDQMRPNVTPEELMRIPLPNAERDRIEGYVSFPGLPPSPFGCPFLADVDMGGPPARRTPVPDDWQVLRPMTEADLARLKLPNSPKVREVLAGGEEEEKEGAP